MACSHSTCVVLKSKVLFLIRSVAIMRKNIAFAVEAYAYFSKGCSVIAIQRAFRVRFHVAPSGPVSNLKSIVTWPLRSDKPRVWRDENWSPSAHQITWEHWGIETVRASIFRSPPHGVLRANMEDVSRKRSWERNFFFFHWRNLFSFKWMREQTEHALPGWNQSSRIAS